MPLVSLSVWSGCSFSRRRTYQYEDDAGAIGTNEGGADGSNGEAGAEGGPAAEGGLDTCNLGNLKPACTVCIARFACCISNACTDAKCRELVACLGNCATSQCANSCRDQFPNFVEPLKRTVNDCNVGGNCQSTCNFNSL